MDERKVDICRFKDGTYGVTINGIVISNNFMDYEAKALVEQLLLLSDDIYEMVLKKKGLS